MKIENENELHEFMVSEGLEDLSKVPVEKVKFGRGVKVAFWFLRIYIILMVFLVIVGFSHVV
ncbi:MAG: hypothetical protein M1327_03535 [Candidatus Thermoplasmatota archaeon]|nr:hypothetical protein [Candidatus Thermoplasmatota archaeon]